MYAFTDDMVLDRAKVGSLQLQFTYVQNLNADHLTAESDVSFVDGFRAAGRVWLRYATINGTLACDNGQFINPGDIALDLEGAKIGSVFMRDGFEADGKVNVYSAVISGTLDCEGGQFINPRGIALNLQGATSGAVLLSNNFTADGQVTLAYAINSNVVDCDNGHFINPGDIALDLEAAKIGTFSCGMASKQTERSIFIPPWSAGAWSAMAANFTTQVQLALNLEATTATGEVLLWKNFAADGQVNLYSAVISGAVACDDGQFNNADAVALNLEAAKTGSIFMRDGFAANGQVRLAYLINSNVVDCDNGHFINPGDIALDLEGAKTGTVLMRNGFEADGEVNLYTAVVSGSLECDGGQFHNPGAVALNLEAAKTGSILMRNGFEADGEVRLYSAVISGTVDCDNGQFCNPGQIALNLESAKTGSILMRNEFAADGEVRLVLMVVSGTVRCDGGEFCNPGQIALNLEGAKTGSVFMRNDFEADGEVNLYTAVIDGSMECDGQFINPRGIALNLEGAKTRFVLLRGVFKAEGTVVLRGAKIDGNLDCDGGTFLSGDDPSSTGKGYAINGDEIDVSGGVLLREGFRAAGTVWLRGAKIGGNLECSGGYFFKPGDWAINATVANIQGSVYLDNRFEANGRLGFQGSQTGHDFKLANVASLKTPILDLSFAKAKALENRVDSWPRQDSALLHGFVFDELSTEAAWDAENQVNWIHLQSRDRFFSQPYEQMAAVFRGMGLQEEAVKVMIEKNKAAGPDAIARDWKTIVKDVYVGWQAKDLRYWWKALETALQALWDLFWYNLFGPFIGYGYRPWRALLLSLIVIAFGWWLFRRGYRVGLITPTGGTDYTVEKDGAHPFSDDHPKFNALVYSVETFVPLVKLGMGEYWTPNGNREASANRRLRFPPKTGRWLRRYLWFHVIAGWVLTTLWVGGFTGLIKT